MTNPGSLTMGFAGVDPRQLAPSVGTMQVGITISAVPSSASCNSRARPDIAHSKDSRSRRTSPPPQQDRLDYNHARTNTTVTAKYSVSDEGADDLEEPRETS